MKAAVAKDGLGTRSTRAATKNLQTLSEGLKNEERVEDHLHASSLDVEKHEEDELNSGLMDDDDDLHSSPEDDDTEDEDMSGGSDKQKNEHLHALQRDNYVLHPLPYRAAPGDGYGGRQMGDGSLPLWLPPKRGRRIRQPVQETDRALADQLRHSDETLQLFHHLRGLRSVPCTSESCDGILRLYGKTNLGIQKWECNVCRVKRQASSVRPHLEKIRQMSMDSSFQPDTGDAARYGYGQNPPAKRSRVGKVTSPNSVPASAMSQTSPSMAALHSASASRMGARGSINSPSKEASTVEGAKNAAAAAYARYGRPVADSPLAVAAAKGAAQMPHHAAVMMADYHGAAAYAAAGAVAMKGRPGMHEQPPIYSSLLGQQTLAVVQLQTDIQSLKQQNGRLREECEQLRRANADLWAVVLLLRDEVLRHQQQSAASGSNEPTDQINGTQATAQATAAITSPPPESGAALRLSTLLSADPILAAIVSRMQSEGQLQKDFVAKANGMHPSVSQHSYTMDPHLLAAQGPSQMDGSLPPSQPVESGRSEDDVDDELEDLEDDVPPEGYVDEEVLTEEGMMEEGLEDEGDLGVPPS